MRNYLEQLYRSSPFGIVIIDRNGVIENISPTQEKTSSIKRQDVVGRKLVNVFPTVMRRYGIIELYQRLLNENVPFKMQFDEYEPQHFNKKVIRFRVWGYPLEDTGKYVILTEDLDIERYEEPSNIIGASKMMDAVFAFIQRASQFDTTVLIEGESGTGKEIVAHAIHANSKRRIGPFLPLNCGALQHPLLASTLFGHERGAFTGAENRVEGYFETAEGGTLFLDEFADIPQDIQVSFLRVLQDGMVTRIGSTKPIRTNVRVICATNKNLNEEVQNKRFRRDLYHRVSILYLRIPPLRERPEDIAPIVKHFMSELMLRHKSSEKRLSSNVMDFFYTYHWPGNVRELANVLESGHITCQNDTITFEDLPLYVREAQIFKSDKDQASLLYSEALVRFQGAYLQKLGERFENDWTTAARHAGVNPSTLYRMRARTRRRGI